MRVFFRRVGSRAAGDSGRAVRAGGSLSLARIGNSPGQGCWPLGRGRGRLGLRAVQCGTYALQVGVGQRRPCNGPVPGPRFVPGTRRGRGEPPLSSATPTPLAACTTARSFQDRGAQNGLPINVNRSTNDQ